MLKTLRPLAFVAAAAITIGTAQHAGATLVGLAVMLDDGVNPTVMVYDNGPGDLNAMAGVLLYSGSIGVWTINVDAAVSKPQIGPARLDLSFSHTSNAAGMLTIKATDTGYALPTAPNTFSLRSRIGGTAHGTVLAEQYVDDQDSPFGLGVGVAHPVLGPGAFASEVFAPTGVLSNPFSITEVVKITHASAGITTGNIGSAVIPAPLALPAGLALLGFVASRRRRGANC